MSDANLSIDESISSKTLIECLRNVEPPQQDYALLASELNAAKKHFPHALDKILAEYFQIFANGYAFWQQSYDYPRVHEYFFSAYLRAKQKIDETSFSELGHDQRTGLERLFRLISLALIHNTDCENSLITNSQRGLSTNATQASEYIQDALDILSDLDLGGRPSDSQLKSILNAFLEMHKVYFDALTLCGELYLVPWGVPLSPEALEAKREVIENKLKDLNVYSRELSSEVRAHFGMAHRGALVYQEQEGLSLRVKQADLIIRAIGYAGRDLINAVFDQFKEDDSPEPLMKFARETSGLKIDLVRNAGYLNEAFETAAGIERLDRVILDLPSGPDGITITVSDGPANITYRTTGVKVSLTRFGSVAVDFDFCIGECDDESVNGVTTSHLRILEALLGPHMGQFEYSWATPPEDQISNPFFRPESSNFVKYYIECREWLNTANESLEMDTLPELEADDLADNLKKVEVALDDWADKLLLLGEKLQDPTRERPYRYDRALGVYTYTLAQRDDLQMSFSRTRALFQEDAWPWLFEDGEADSDDVTKLRRKGRDLFPKGRLYVKLPDIGEEIMRRVGSFLKAIAQKRGIAVSNDNIHTRFWMDRNTGWHSTLLCNRIALHPAVGKECEPFTEEQHLEIINNPQFKALTLQDREARAGLDDWQFAVQPPYRTNLGTIRSHNTDVVYVGPNTVLIYLPDDPQFIAIQYVVSTRLIGDLRTIVLAHQTYNKELIKKIEAFLDGIEGTDDWKSAIERFRKRDEFKDLVKDWDCLLDFDIAGEGKEARLAFLECLRSSLRMTRRQVNRVLDLVRDSSLTKYDDHGELLRSMVRVSQMAIVNGALEDSTTTLDNLYSYLTEIIEKIRTTAI